jgi:transposase-like protein
MGWGLALVSVFIPVAHFVLVPTFALAGVLLAALRAREDRRLMEVRGACPRCGTEQRFKVGGRFAPERSLDCPRCHSNLVLRADDGGRAP